VLRGGRELDVLRTRRWRDRRVGGRLFGGDGNSDGDGDGDDDIEGYN
jgi:hypothetical protein